MAWSIQRAIKERGNETIVNIETTSYKLRDQKYYGYCGLIMSR